MTDKMEIRGTEHDWEKYNKAIAKRWEEIVGGLTHCKLHNTVFSHDEEPCWSCWDEFEIEL